MRKKDPYNNAAHVAVRFDPETLGRLERVRLKMGEKAAEFGILLTISDVMRAAVARGLVSLESEHGIPVGRSVPAPEAGRGRPRRPIAAPASKPRK